MANGQKDELLECLLYVSQHFGIDNVIDALLAGLPLPHGKITKELFPRVAFRAGLSAEYFDIPLENIPSLLLPCIICLKDNKSVVLTQIDTKEKKAAIYYPLGSRGVQTVSIDALNELSNGDGFFIKRKMHFDGRAPEILKPRSGHWFWSTLFESIPIYKDVLVASILINLFAITSPIFTMNVYDKIVPNLAFDSLWVLAIGVGIVFTFDFILRQLRSYFIDIAGKKSDLLLSAKIFNKVMGIRMESRPNSTGAFARHLTA